MPKDYCDKEYWRLKNLGYKGPAAREIARKKLQNREKAVANLAIANPAVKVDSKRDVAIAKLRGAVMMIQSGSRLDSVSNQCGYTAIGMAVLRMRIWGMGEIRTVAPGKMSAEIERWVDEDRGDFFEADPELIAERAEEVRAARIFLPYMS